ncbi:DUF2752 domain-containing protein [Pedobacter sp. BMA]|uniref:DUF2752 domain-containing protein n=1 Tax=Pedobacter sp. BMA TaxID=1663685 RepID=UPI0009E52B32
MITLQVFCSLVSFVNWLQNHLLPCPFKTITGLDCPGCGFQRSLVALITGDFVKSFLLYPPSISIIISFLSGLFFYNFPKNRKYFLFKPLVIITGNIIMFSYIYKMLFA